MKSVVKAFDKWLRNNWPEASPIERIMAQRAYKQGRKDLLAEQKRRAQLAAERKRLTSSE